MREDKPLWKDLTQPSPEERTGNMAMDVSTEPLGAVKSSLWPCLVSELLLFVLRAYQWKSSVNQTFSHDKQKGGLMPGGHVGKRGKET